MDKDIFLKIQHFFILKGLRLEAVTSSQNRSVPICATCSDPLIKILLKTPQPRRLVSNDTMLRGSFFRTIRKRLLDPILSLTVAPPGHSQSRPSLYICIFLSGPRGLNAPRRTAIRSIILSWPMIEPKSACNRTEVSSSFPPSAAFSLRRLADSLHLNKQQPSSRVLVLPISSTLSSQTLLPLHPQVSIRVFKRERQNHLSNIT